MKRRDFTVQTGVALTCSRALARPPAVMNRIAEVKGCCRPARTSGQPPTPRPRRLAWAELLKRTFAVDVLRCAHWGGRRELLAVVMKADAVAGP